ncbi:MAG: hypothetical protein ACK5PR_03360 [bacterium]
MNDQLLCFPDCIQAGSELSVETLIYHVRISKRNQSGSYHHSFIDYPDARKLVEMLVKHTHPGHSIEPNKPAKAPQLILAWQHPVNGRRFIQVSSELVATQSADGLRRHWPDFPIWLAQITKQYVQPNPTYEWKDL